MRGDRLSALILLIFVSCFFSKEGCAETQTTDIPTCRSGTFKDETYLTEAVEYYAVENVYVKFECTSLPEGTYNLQLEWVTPKGQLQQTSSQAFTVESKQDYVVYFTFKLNRNGLFRQTFSGEDFAQSQLGEWKIISYLNNHKIGERFFQILE